MTHDASDDPTAPSGPVAHEHGLEALFFSPESVLDRDPGLLFDPHFLGPLHAELRSELGSDDARTALFQMGFLHGLRDAHDAASLALEAGAAAPSPPIAIQMRRVAGPLPAAIAMSGVWPERHEADAVVNACGASDEPCCAVSAGYTSGWLSGHFDANLVARETQCVGAGAVACRFEAEEAELWPMRDAALGSLVDALPFEAMRRFVRERAEPCDRSGAHRLEDAARVEAQRDRPNGESVVHIWGPVMVVPFGRGDEALRAIDLIGADPATRDVSVVVVDLAGAVVDAAFGASALEQTLEAVAATGAESIITHVSSLSEATVAELEPPPTFVCKDLAESITVAFQIARAQRRPS